MLLQFKIIFILSLYVYFKCNPIPKPCPFFATHIVRPMTLIVQRSYDLLLCHFYDIILFVLLLCVTMCYIACILIRKFRYVTFSTCLNTLPTQVRAKPLKLDLVYYVVLTMASIPRTEGHIVLISHRICLYLCVFLIKVSKYLPFKFYFLCYFKLILILSADVETQPGPKHGVALLVDLTMVSFLSVIGMLTRSAKMILKGSRLLKHIIHFLCMI